VPCDDRLLLELPAVRLAELIRRRELSPVEVVEAHIARTLAVNPQLNAMVDDLFDRARDEARAAEAEARRGSDRPLLGVPCTIKEFIAVTGASWTAGLWVRRGRRADRDATVVQRLRGAGAIVLGITNVPEGGMWMETYNPIYGRTNNPWDVRRTPGGSSGGEAALIAAGASPLGLGSDIAGSVRIPAAMCGIVAHKPTERLVPNTGHWGGTNDEADRMLCIGPMGRCVGDVEHALEVIAGPDGTTGAALPAREPGDLRGVRVFPVIASGRTPLAPVMRDAVERTARALAARGADVVPLDDATWRHVFGRSVSVWLRGLASAGDGQPFADLITEGAPLALIPELARIVRGKPRFATATLGLVALERLSGPLERVLARDIPPLDELRGALETVLGPRGVLLHPPYARPAPRHFVPLLSPFASVFTALFSVFGMPATVVPVGFDRRNLPVGVQVIGRRGNDRLTLAVARAIEETFGGWTPAPLGRDPATADQGRVP
jgi:fatty acid amide hydrolase 2